MKCRFCGGIHSDPWSSARTARFFAYEFVRASAIALTGMALIAGLVIGATIGLRAIV